MPNSVTDVEPIVANGTSPRLSEWTIKIITSTGFECHLRGDGVPKSLEQWKEGSVLRCRLGRGSTFMQEARKQARATLKDLLKEAGATCSGPAGNVMGTLADALKRSCATELHLPCAQGLEAPRFHWSWTYPWELLLTSVCDCTRTESQTVIVRVLDDQPAAESQIESVTVVKCNPGRLREIYPDETMDLEEQTISENAGVPSRPQKGGSLAQLGNVSAQNTGAIHFACIDVHQYDDEMRNHDDGAAWQQHPFDGLVLGGSTPEIASSADIAKALCSTEPRPTLVTYNAYQSGYRTAPETVAAGTGAAIGFEGRLNDNKAENFFADFYMAYAQSDWRVLDAFAVALWRLADAYQGSVPTGVLLWTNGSLPLFANENSEDNARLKRRFEALRKKVAKLRDLPPEAAIQLHEYAIRPCAELNYSLLHNGRGIFDLFSLRKTPSVGKVGGVHISVRLQAGAESAEYRGDHEMPYRYLVLNEEIKVPLTSELLRSTRSAIYTSIFVLVKTDKETIYERTHRVKLLPIDQWQDDDLNRHWLPSFVWAEDPAVKTIIDGAQKYLAAISDDSSLGFAGYQHSSEDFESVHNQVRAIWWTLVNDLPLTYINPPPTFGVSAQRVRTPSDILANRRGTCLDLALLMAACLEYVDIRPVIFLLYGHAFPGYFASSEAQEKFWTNAYPPDAGESPWMFGGFENYLQVLEAIREGSLVPLETLVLNSRGAFADAVSEGGVNLRDPQAFQYMIDIRSARTSDVNPLPIEKAL